MEGAKFIMAIDLKKLSEQEDVIIAAKHTLDETLSKLPTAKLGDVIVRMERTSNKFSTLKIWGPNYTTIPPWNMSKLRDCLCALIGVPTEEEIEAVTIEE